VRDAGVDRELGRFGVEQYLEHRPSSSDRPWRSRANRTRRSPHEQTRRHLPGAKPRIASPSVSWSKPMPAAPIVAMRKVRCLFLLRIPISSCT
jgi:hypothetical protein